MIKKMRETLRRLYRFLFPMRAARKSLQRAIEKRFQQMLEKTENGEPLSESDRQLIRLVVSASQKRWWE
jgi:hypothetical protein